MAFWGAIVAAVPPEALPRQRFEGVKRMTDGQSRAFGCSLMQFGKYNGQRIDEIPRDYLEWLVEEQETFLRKLQGYLMSDRVKREAEDG